MTHRLPSGVDRLQSGRYRGTVHVSSKPRRRVTDTFDTAKAAGQWVQDQRSQLRRGEWRDPRAGRIRWEDWWDKWMAARHVEPRTARADQARAARRIIPQWRGRGLGQIARIDVQSWVTGLLRQGVGRAEVRACYTLFAAAMAAAVEEGLIGQSPCRAIRGLERQRPAPRWWTVSEVEAILAVLPPPYRLVAALMAWCGLRWEEAAGLRVCDVSWHRREVTVTVVIADRRVKEYPKEVASRRTVPMAGPVADLLKPAWTAASADRGRSGLVTVARDGRPASDDTWRATWRRYLKGETRRRSTGKRRLRPAAGVPYHSAHALRHSGASWLVQAGVSLEMVGAWLGHEPGSDATKIYAHLAPESTAARVREVLAALDASAAPHVKDQPARPGR